MPELPEVETVRRGLAGWVVGRMIASVDVRHPRATRRHLAGPDDFARRLLGRTILDVCRRGKYLWMPLSAPEGGTAEEALLGHLGMSGQLLLRPGVAPEETHLRVRIRFSGGDPELRYVDQRTFGGLSVEPLVPDLAGPTATPVPAPVRHIARDPLDPAFDEAAFTAALRRRHTGVKRALLDQSLVSGIGNIYADEALWRARLHWARPTETLTRPVVSRLVAAVREVMAEALGDGGTSFDRLYVDVNGDSGYFDRSLSAYGRRDEPCPRCGTPIRREAFMNRSSFSCPRCQPRPRRARL